MWQPRGFCISDIIGGRGSRKAMALEAIEEQFQDEDVAARVATLAEALGRSRKSVALTGAGISTESGIPDYRGPNGLWAKHTPIYFSDYVRSPTVRRRY